MLRGILVILHQCEITKIPLNTKDWRLISFFNNVRKGHGSNCIC
jgi:hypothetical protein